MRLGRGYWLIGETQLVDIYLVAAILAGPFLNRYNAFGLQTADGFQNCRFGKAGPVV